ncbi:MAG: helix-turn-helix transcriptional regulator [Streptococcus salivarius]|nr:TetR/AcrR family transcriptional regulator [Streptococcus equinus]MBS5180734.1 helix-turn-helix transcriptional regulator [Streptococcus salivarius]MDU2932656.1 helix-turn-helix domain-containing protein [Streptococcus salivarius]
MENTRELILAVATEQFLKNGYEKTKLSDIINGLDGLTKGAIYHYFDSKEDIFNEVANNIGKQNKSIFDAIKYSNDINGSEKITKLVSLSINNEIMETITSITPKLIHSPKLLTSFLEQMQKVTIPDYFIPIIKEGIEDGSIIADNPNELAELLAVLLNIWLNPLIFNTSKETLISKINLINICLNNFNIKISI